MVSGIEARQGKALLRLGKAEVTGSSPVVGSSDNQTPQGIAGFCYFWHRYGKPKPVPNRCHFIFRHYFQVKIEPDPKGLRLTPAYREKRGSIGPSLPLCHGHHGPRPVWG